MDNAAQGVRRRFWRVCRTGISRFHALPAVSVVTLFCLCSTQGLGIEAAHWAAIGGVAGPNGTVRASVADASGNVYIAGDFTQIGGVAANRVAKWNGAEWSALGPGLDGSGLALALMGTDLYVGGNFQTAGSMPIAYVAKWDGTGWSSLGSGPTGVVAALAVNGNDLYVGGKFAMASGASVNGVAKWNGSAWSALGGGVTASGSTASVAALAVSGGDLYVGGAFSRAGTGDASNIARWNGSSWSSLQTGVVGQVACLLVDGPAVYVGGSITHAGSLPAANIARWDGNAWFTLGSGAEGPVWAMAAKGSGILVGGGFASAGSAPAAAIAVWNGTGWAGLNPAPGINATDSSHPRPEIRTIAAHDGDFYVGGTFGLPFPTNSTNLAVWQAGEWAAVANPGMPSYLVRSLAAGPNDLYVSGSFNVSGSTQTYTLARWDGRRWSPLGSPDPLRFVEESATAAELIPWGSDLYVGGAFTTAGGVPAKGLAKWDGREWSGVGGGVVGQVLCGRIVDNALYVGGQFSTAGGNPATNVAKWDGANWTALGAEFGSYVFDIEEWNGDIYAAGASYVPPSVEELEGHIGHFVAKWDGLHWLKIGGEFSDTVGRIKAGATGLYAYGYFGSVGNLPISRVAKWDGTTWNALGPQSGQLWVDFGGWIEDLVVRDDELFVSGLQLAVGSDPGRASIAHWDGVQWSLMPGVSGHVLALAVKGEDLYAGGHIAEYNGYRSWVGRCNLAGDVADTDGDGLLDSWEMANFAFREGRGAADDADGDGLSALLEEALGLDPTLPDVSGEPPVVEEGGYLTMTVPKHAGVAYEVQSAGTLFAGQPDSFSAATTTVLINDATTLKVRDNVPVAGAPHRFMRLKVTAAP